jgi:hypothetical protein
MWRPIVTAPFDLDLELAVLDDAIDEYVALVFPCRRVGDGWMNLTSKERIDIDPTHWREWQSRA